MKRELAESGSNPAVPVDHEVRRFVENSRSENTKSAYRKDWESFEAWCTARDLCPLPATPSTMARYAAESSRRWKPSTIHRHLISISVAHQAKGLQSPMKNPLVRSTLQGIRRQNGSRKTRKEALRAHELREIVSLLPDDFWGMRNKAILLIGYAGAFRRSELVGIQHEDLHFVEKGVRIRVPRSKSDQTGEGINKDIAYGVNPITCPVLSLNAWLIATRITSGPVFRSIDRFGNLSPSQLSPQSVGLIVKSSVKLLGRDPAHYGGHSLRAGLVTDLIKCGVSTQIIKQLTGHKYEGSLQVYYRESETFTYNLNEKLGL